MSGSRPRSDPRAEAARRATRVQLPLLERLMDDAPDDSRDPVLSASDAMLALRNAVRRDMEALLNARRPWLPPPPSCSALKLSPFGYGVPDVMAATLADPRRRESLRADIEDTVRSFEPRFSSVRVTITENADKLEATLRLRIDAMLRAEPAPEPVAFDTLIAASAARVVVHQSDDV
ncbi:MAG: type VI secretion system baseplate subunit TssE [Acetobacteraceae bacterium]|nr:type VI secretion system baseplate subunit TssE [Acetobacteraceae bacterium]